MTSALPHLPTAVKPCPPLTKRNSKIWEPLIALGCNNGFLYIFNLNKNVIVKKSLVFTSHPINGIEWISMNTLIAWSSQNVVSTSTSNSNHQEAALNSPNIKQNNVKNELVYTDLRTGLLKEILRKRFHIIMV